MWVAADPFGRRQENGRKPYYLCSVSSRSFMYLVVFSLRWLSGEGERETHTHTQLIIILLLAWYPSSTLKHLSRDDAKSL